MSTRCVWPPMFCDVFICVNMSCSHLLHAAFFELVGFVIPNKHLKEDDGARSLPLEKERVGMDSSRGDGGGRNRGRDGGGGARKDR